MEHKYGNFTKEQLIEHKTKLRKSIFWLLLYIDPNTKDQYPDIDFEKYYDSLMRRIDGLNTLLFKRDEIVVLLSTLQAAKNELDNENFNFKIYRKLILDAGSMVDKIKVGD